MKKLCLAAALVALCTLLLLIPPTEASRASCKGLQKAIDASVMIAVVGEGNPFPAHGTGVAFRNGDRTFIWTAGHVVSRAQVIRRVQVFTKGTHASEVLECLYYRVKLIREVYEGEDNPLKVGEEMRYGRVVRHSDYHDLAILEVFGKDWPKHTTEFAANRPPRVGTPIWHIGCMYGPPGHLSVSRGIFSTPSRWRNNGVGDDIRRPLIWDQFNGTVLPGSSGGGVFNSQGHCMGIVTEFLGAGAHGQCIYVPARRMREFAASYECEWALSEKIPVPEKDTRSVYCDAIEVRK